jgi:hypothetical protein
MGLREHCTDHYFSHMNPSTIPPPEPIVLERFESGARIERCPTTGLPVYVSPPGTPMLTSEKVRSLMEEIP